MQESGTASILDMFRVAKEPDYCCVAPLPREQILGFFGTDQPTREVVEENLSDLFETLERGQGVYIITYRDGQPSEIYFGGYSFD